MSQLYNDAAVPGFATGLCGSMPVRGTHQGGNRCWKEGRPSACPCCKLPPQIWHRVAGCHGVSNKFRMRSAGGLAGSWQTGLTLQLLPTSQCFHGLPSAPLYKA
eukprot:660559-Pelagomonas_calceolata.AAC.1